MTPHEQIKEKILTLETALLESNPRMPVLLREIHTALKNDPAVVTLLSEEEIATYVSGLAAHTQVHLMGSAAKPSGKAKLAKVTTDDLGF